MSGENIYTHGMWSIVVKKYDPDNGLYLKLRNGTGFECDLSLVIEHGDMIVNGDRIPIPQDVFNWLLIVHDQATDWAFI